MKKIILFVILILCIFSQVQAREGVAIGVIVGKPLAFNIKSWLGERTGLNVNFGYNLTSKRLYMNFDLLYHFEVVYNAPFYLGAGPLVEIDSGTQTANNAEYGIRTLAGWEIFLRKTPSSLFLEGGGEWRLNFQKNQQFITPDVLYGLGIRFYLN